MHDRYNNVQIIRREKRRRVFFKYAGSHVGDCSDFGVVDFYIALSFRQVPK